MIKVISKWYLWFLPISFLFLGDINNRFGLSILIIVGILYLAAVIFAIKKNWSPASPIYHKSSPRTAGTALILGGALTWLLGSIGPPDFRNPVILLLNSGGLLTGTIIVLIGLAILTASFWDIGNRNLLLLGLISFIIATIFWIGQRMVLWSLIPLGHGDPEKAADNSELLKFLFIARYGLATVYHVAGYLASIPFVIILWKCKWIGKTGTIIMIFFGVALAIFQGFWLQKFPLPPAFVCLLPYFMGVLLISRNTNTQKN